jgi:hypothetical protein
MEMGKRLKSVFQGHLNCYGDPGNGNATSAFRAELAKSLVVRPAPAKSERVKPNPGQI